MNKKTLFFSMTSLLTIATTNAAAEPLRAVIGLNSSQIVEDTQSSNPLTLSPIPGTLLPLDKQFANVTQPIASNLPNWSAQLGHAIQVDNKQHALSYTGTLATVDTRNQTFTLNIKGKEVQLPINDFYLIPLEENKPQQTLSNTTYQGVISYQSNELTWTPKRTLIINQDNVSIINMANIENTSSKNIDIKNSLLHYSHQEAPRFKVERSSLMMSADATQQVDYSDSEVTYPIQDLTVPANSHTLTDMSLDTVKVDNSKGVADVSTGSYLNANLTLSFKNTLTFTLSKAALPGQYQTYWQRDGLLIPGDIVSVPLARANQTLKVTTNQNLDITGKLKLISASSGKLPATQEWMLTLKNHSNNLKQFSVTQNTQGVIANVEGSKTILEKNMKKTANSIQFEGSLQAQESKTIRYTLKLNE